MAVGFGVVLLVLGFILALDVVTVDISFVEDNALGVILIVAGIVAIGLSLILNSQRSRRSTIVDDRPISEDRR